MLAVVFNFISQLKLLVYYFKMIYYDVSFLGLVKKKCVVYEYEDFWWACVMVLEAVKLILKKKRY